MCTPFVLFWAVLLWIKLVSFHFVVIEACLLNVFKRACSQISNKKRYGKRWRNEESWAALLCMFTERNSEDPTVLCSVKKKKKALLSHGYKWSFTGLWLSEVIVENLLSDKLAGFCKHLTNNMYEFFLNLTMFFLFIFVNSCWSWWQLNVYEELWWDKTWSHAGEIHLLQQQNQKEVKKKRKKKNIGLQVYKQTSIRKEKYK